VSSTCCHFAGEGPSQVFSCCFLAKTNFVSTSGTRDGEWQWHQLGYMQICTSPQIEYWDAGMVIYLLQAGCTSCHPTNSIKALKA